MRVVSFKQLYRGALRGYAKVQLRSGIVIHDCPIFCKDGQCWASLPSKPQLDQGGKQVEVEGKKQYSPVCEWPNRELGELWSKLVVQMIRERWPDALGDAANA
jgi:hypothetical protein